MKTKTWLPLAFLALFFSIGALLYHFSSLPKFPREGANPDILIPDQEVPAGKKVEVDRTRDTGRQAALEPEKAALGPTKLKLRVKVVWKGSTRVEPNARVFVWRNTKSGVTSPFVSHKGDEKLSAHCDPHGVAEFEISDPSICLQAFVRDKGMSRVSVIETGNEASLSHSVKSVLLRLEKSVMICGDVLDKDGHGVAHALVSLGFSGEPLGTYTGYETSLIPLVETQESGAFSVQVPMNSEYYIYATSGKDSGTDGQQSSGVIETDYLYFEVKEKNVLGLKLFLKGRYTILGRVVTSTGLPAGAGFLVGGRSETMGTGVSCLTNAKGEFKLLIHTAGKYEISFLHDDHALGESQTAVISESTPTRFLVLRIPPETSVHVKVKGADATVLRYLEVGALTYQENGDLGEQKNGYPLPNGSWELRGMALGREYHFWCRRKGDEEEFGLRRALRKKVTIRDPMPLVIFDVKKLNLRRNQVSCDLRGIKKEGWKVEVALAMKIKDRWKTITRKVAKKVGVYPFGKKIIPHQKYRFFASDYKNLAGMSRVFSSVDCKKPIPLTLGQAGRLVVATARKSNLGRVRVEDMNGPVVNGSWRLLRPHTITGTERFAEWLLPKGLYFVRAELGTKGEDGTLRRRVLVIPGKRVVVHF